MIDLQAIIRDRVLFFDGAMGTMLQQAGLPLGALPETYVITHPEVVTDIHRQYVAAGAEVILTNTFQANAYKLAGSGYGVEEIIAGAIACVKAAGAPYCALDISTTGQLLEPMGTLSFEKAYELFKEQVIAGEKHGADLILFETFSDLYEMKAAILAAKENTSLPIIASMTYQEDGRTFVGTDPVSASITLSGLGVDALGVNCSLGPKELMPLVEQLLRYAKVPVIVQANAGLPVLRDGQSVYDISPEEYAGYAAEMVKKGVRILGGCCGTTPAFIAAMLKAVKDIPFTQILPEAVTATTSASQTVFINKQVAVIGERINPTGKKKLKEAIVEQRMDYILREAIDQAEAGANILDVNMGLPKIDEAAMLAKAVKAIQSVVNLPLQIDSADPAAIEAACRVYNGKAIINSVNGKQSVMDAVFPIAKKYGALVVGLTLDEDGIPATAEERLAVAKKIVACARDFGIDKEDILIDCLVLTASAQQEQVMETLKAIRLVKRELGVHTVLGVSNVSFGLPGRERLNATFLAAAFGAGLDAPILNPLSASYRQVVDTFRVLNNEDKDAAYYISAYANTDKTTPPAPQTSQRTLRDIIIQGRKDESAPKVRDMLADYTALDIVDSHFIPALNEVGSRFEKGTLFLPQLMQSADAVAAGFAVLKEQMEQTGETRASRGRMIMATVQGDIHDIGKNIVRMILENYGYDVIDLGKDVPIEAVAEAIRVHDVHLVGLSALMTTTVQSMKDTITHVRSLGLDCTFFVGGAVLNPEYASFVGADYYAKDAMESVAVANKFFGHE